MGEINFIDMFISFINEYFNIFKKDNIREKSVLYKRYGIECD